MNKLLGATVALVISAGVYKVSAQQAGPPPSQTSGTQAGNGGQMGPPQGDHKGPPPNVQQAIALLDQAKQQSTGNTASLIDQAEALLKRPPPPQRGGMGGQGGQGQSGQMQGPPPQ